MSQVSSNQLRYGSYAILTSGSGQPLEIGAGAFGSIFIAQDSRDHSQVALKVIQDKLVNNPSVRERFKAEMREHGRLNHPGIVRIVGSGEQEGSLFYAMEYCRGGDLGKFVEKSGPLAPIQALQVGRQIADALVYAHGYGICHRDLKPSNILLAQEGQLGSVKVSDFGLVKRTWQAGPSQMSHSGGYVGTIQFSSPEQIREAELDVRSDVFSLGLTLWHLLVGAFPLTKGGRPLTMLELVTDRTSDDSYMDKLPSNLPPSVRDLLGKMLAKDRDARFENCGRLVMALDDCLHELLEQPTRSAHRQSQATSTFSAAPPLKEFFSTAPAGQMSLGTLFDAKDLKTGVDAELVLLRKELPSDALWQIKHNVANLANSPHPSLSMLDLREFREGLALIRFLPQRSVQLFEQITQSGPQKFSKIVPTLQSIASGIDHAYALDLPGVEDDPRLISVQINDDGSRFPIIAPRLCSALENVSNSGGEITSNMATMASMDLMDGPTSFRPASSFASIAYWLLTARGAPGAAFIAAGAYLQVNGLSREANAVLRDSLCGNYSGTAHEVLHQLAAAENFPLGPVPGESAVGLRLVKPQPQPQSHSSQPTPKIIPLPPDGGPRVVPPPPSVNQLPPPPSPSTSPSQPPARNPFLEQDPAASIGGKAFLQAALQAIEESERSAEDLRKQYEQDQRQREAEERHLLEAQRIALLAEEAKRKQAEAELAEQKRVAEEARLKQAEIERQAREAQIAAAEEMARKTALAEKQAKEEADRKLKEAEERNRKIQEKLAKEAALAEKRAKEEAEKKLKEEAERNRQIQEKLTKEAALAEKRAKEEADRKLKEAEERNRQLQEKLAKEAALAQKKAKELQDQLARQKKLEEEAQRKLAEQDAARIKRDQEAKALMSQEERVAADLAKKREDAERAAAAEARAREEAAKRAEEEQRAKAAAAERAAEEKAAREAAAKRLEEEKIAKKEAQERERAEREALRLAELRAKAEEKAAAAAELAAAAAEKRKAIEAEAAAVVGTEGTGSKSLKWLLVLPLIGCALAVAFFIYNQNHTAQKPDVANVKPPVTIPPITSLPRKIGSIKVTGYAESASVKVDQIPGYEFIKDVTDKYVELAVYQKFSDAKRLESVQLAADGMPEVIVIPNEANVFNLSLPLEPNVKVNLKCDPKGDFSNWSLKLSPTGDGIPIALPLASQSRELTCRARLGDYNLTWIFRKDSKSPVTCEIPILKEWDLKAGGGAAAAHSPFILTVSNKTATATELSPPYSKWRSVAEVIYEEPVRRLKWRGADFYFADKFANHYLPHSRLLSFDAGGGQANSLSVIMPDPEHFKKWGGKFLDNRDSFFYIIWELCDPKTTLGANLLKMSLHPEFATHASTLKKMCEYYVSPSGGGALTDSGKALEMTQRLPADFNELLKGLKYMQDFVGEDNPAENDYVRAWEALFKQTTAVFMLYTRLYVDTQDYYKACLSQPGGIKAAQDNEKQWIQCISLWLQYCNKIKEGIASDGRAVQGLTPVPAKLLGLNCNGSMLVEVPKAELTFVSNEIFELRNENFKWTLKPHTELPLSQSQVNPLVLSTKLNFQPAIHQ